MYSVLHKYPFLVLQWKQDYTESTTHRIDLLKALVILSSLEFLFFSRNYQLLQSNFEKNGIFLLYTLSHIHNYQL